MADNPYTNLPARAFWKQAGAPARSGGAQALWQPKFEVSAEDPVVTFGSCFAQHFSAALTAHNYTWFDAEPLPPFVRAGAAAKLNYGVFSARTGNIYSTALLRQWLAWASGAESPAEEIWTAGDGVIDPFRPLIEPGGFVSSDEMLRSREAVFAALRCAMEQASVFVFTLGLTEAWHNAKGYVYPMCPGTAGGQFDPDCHRLINHDYLSTRRELEAAIDLLRAANPNIRILLTVSPVPLTATATDQHVIAATTYSKSVLRAVAGDVAATSAEIDYFPSYEIITSPVFEGRFFAPNLRQVTKTGVDTVMQVFFDAISGRPARFAAQPWADEPDLNEVVSKTKLPAAFTPPSLTT